MNLSYPFVLEAQKNGGFVVQFVDLEEAFTEGDTVEECIFNAQEVLTGILEQRLADGDELPIPSLGKYKFRVFPSASVQAALLVRLARQGRSLADLARSLNTSWPVAQRLENPKHPFFFDPEALRFLNREGPAN
ncbi:MAG: type II toxin-antitoxin system HicB family antitoxin [Candidatus Ozemobacteraceae bacterium]